MAEFKETLEQSAELQKPSVAVETRRMVDVKPNAFVPRGLESFLKKIEQNPTPVSVSDASGQPQLSTPISTNPKVALPVTRSVFLSGFKKQIDDVSNWLSRFIFRKIKLKEGNVSFKPDDS